VVADGRFKSFSLLPIAQRDPLLLHVRSGGGAVLRARATARAARHPV